MISFSNPKCPTTQRSATCFCFTEGCCQSAFSCQNEEFINHKHGPAGKMNLLGSPSAVYPRSHRRGHYCLPMWLLSRGRRRSCRLSSTISKSFWKGTAAICGYAGKRSSLQVQLKRLFRQYGMERLKQ